MTRRFQSFNAPQSGAQSGGKVTEPGADENVFRKPVRKQAMVWRSRRMRENEAGRVGGKLVLRGDT